MPPPPYENAQAQKHAAISTSTRTLRLSIDGMTCAACIQTIGNALLELDGVKSVSVSLPLARATVVFDADVLSSVEIGDAIREAGYGVKIGGRNAEENRELLSQSGTLQSLRISFSSAAFLSSVVVAIDAFPASSLLPWLWSYVEILLFSTRLVLASKVILYDSSWIHQGAWARGRLTLGMDTLISLSLLLGMALSFLNISLQGWSEAQTHFSSGCFLATVVTAGRYLDLVLRRKSTASFASLYRLQSETAMVFSRKDEVCVVLTVFLEC